MRSQTSGNWRLKHFDLLRRSFSESPYAADALEMVERVYSSEFDNISRLARASMLELVDYFGLTDSVTFVDSVDLNINGSSSERVLNIVKALGGTSYITGHGAARYLNHRLFDEAGIGVHYMNYQLRAYPQPFGEFTPYVSGLDLVANCGKAGIDFICSNAISREYFNVESRR